MARDYARTRSSGKGKGKAKRRRPAAKPKKPATPGWVWMLSGICVGVVAAAGLYLYSQSGTRNGVVQPVPTPSEGAGAAKTSKDAQPEEPRFAFYEMLPNYEVVIPKQDGGATGGERAGGTSPQVERPGRYIIQAGSFTRYEDADRRKAELALLGVESKIAEAEINDGRTIYRVRTLPKEDLQAINRTLERLREEGIDTLVMRHKG